MGGRQRRCYRRPLQPRRVRQLLRRHGSLLGRLQRLEEQLFRVGIQPVGVRAVRYTPGGPAADHHDGHRTSLHGSVRRDLRRSTDRLRGGGIGAGSQRRAYLAGPQAHPGGVRPPDRHVLRAMERGSPEVRLGDRSLLVQPRLRLWRGRRGRRRGAGQRLGRGARHAKDHGQLEPEQRAQHSRRGPRGDLDSNHPGELHRVRRIRGHRDGLQALRGAQPVRRP